MDNEIPFDEKVHWAYDMPKDYHSVDYCFMSNLDAPIIRSAARPFKSFYSCEWSYHGYHTIDPARSIAEMIIARIGPDSTEPSGWPSCDMFGFLMVDLGFDWRNPTLADLVAFWTMFPVGTADFLSESYMKYRCYLESNGNIPRVLNNPFFYKDANASDGRIVEIAEDGGFRYAIDRAKFFPKPDVLAHEIAVLNHGVHEAGKVTSVGEILSRSITETMTDWGLIHV